MVKHWIICLRWTWAAVRAPPQKAPSYYFKHNVEHPSEAADRLLTASYLCFVSLSHFTAVKYITTFPCFVTVDPLKENPVFNFLLSLTANPPRSVDPDDSNVAEKNALLVFLVLTWAALLSPVGRVGELRHGALLHCGTCVRKGCSWKTQMEKRS